MRRAIEFIERWPALSLSEERSVRALGPHGQPGSMDRGKKSAGSAIECESTILPRRLLTESGEPLNEAPHRAWIAFVLFREVVRQGRGFRRQFQFAHSRLNHFFARAP